MITKENVSEFTEQLEIDRKKRILVKAIIVKYCRDVRYKDRILVFDGTGFMTAKNHSAMEVKLKNGELHYCPLAGYISRIDFPELKEGEVKDEEMINLIKQKIR